MCFLSKRRLQLRLEIKGNPIKYFQRNKTKWTNEKSQMISYASIDLPDEMKKKKQKFTIFIYIF